MRVFVHDYTKAAEASALVGKALRCALSQTEPPPSELRALLEQAATALDTYLASDNLVEEDSDEIYNGFVPFNDISHLFQ